MSDLTALAGLYLREAVRQRIPIVVVIFTVGFLSLYAFAVDAVFENTPTPAGLPIDQAAVNGSALVGIASSVVLLLGVVLAVFLTAGAVRGDAERGLLQALTVRPGGRLPLLIARLGVASLLSAFYVAAVFLAVVELTDVIGGYRPERIAAPATCLAGGVLVVTALSAAGSTVLSSAANGITTFVLFASAVTAGLIGQTGELLGSAVLQDVGRAVAWALPFQALHQEGLAELGRGPGGSTIVLQGPFGGAIDAGGSLWLWTAGYVAALVAIALTRFQRLDL